MHTKAAHSQRFRGRELRELTLTVPLGGEKCWGGFLHPEERMAPPPRGLSVSPALAEREAWEART